MLQDREVNDEAQAEHSCVHDEGLLIHSNDEKTACDFFQNWNLTWPVSIPQ